MTERRVGAGRDAARLAAHSVAILVVVVRRPAHLPVFAMRRLLRALRLRFNLLIGYVGLLSFGPRTLLRGASYASAHAALAWGWPPELAVLFSVLVSAALACWWERSPSAGKASTSR